MVSVAVCRSLMSRPEHFIRVCLPTYPAAFAHSTCALIMNDQLCHKARQTYCSGFDVPTRTQQEFHCAVVLNLTVELQSERSDLYLGWRHGGH